MGPSSLRIFFFIIAFLLIKLNTTGALLTPFSGVIQKKKNYVFLPQIFSFLRKEINALETGTKTRLFNPRFFSKIKSQLLHLSCKGPSANSNLKLIESVIEFDVKFFSHLIWHQVWL